jgi:transcriptional regulator with XRE-family HTH domain
MRTASEHKIDRLIGDRIRIARAYRKWNQDELGEAIGVTFQQVQKYENAVNRVSVSRLMSIAVATGMPLSFFLEPLDGGVEADPAFPGAMVLASRICALSPEAKTVVEATLAALEAGARPLAAE